MPSHVFHVENVEITSELARLRLVCGSYDPYRIEGSYTEKDGLLVIKVTSSVTDEGRLLPVAPDDVVFFNSSTGTASYDADLVRGRTEATPQPLIGLAGA